MIDMTKPTDEELIEGSKAGAFSLEHNFEIMDNMPPRFQKVREEKEEVIKFFDKIPEGKVMKIKFPNEFLWKTYHTALKYYASGYAFDMQFNKRKDEGGYSIYIHKLRREKDEKKD